jgi:ADP-ribosylglycohydrolase
MQPKPIPSLTPDHAERMGRVLVALDGLSVGDAFGGQFFIPHNRKFLFGPKREAPPPGWGYTDDTEMALGIYEVLNDYGSIFQDELARIFAQRYLGNMYRGYGAGAHRILSAIGRGEPWQEVSRREFNGTGSKGNGSAMRVAPVGAYFADDLTKAAEQARLSAEVTHAHPEGIAGGIAAAVATAYAWQARDRVGDESVARGLFEAVLAFTPPGATRRGIAEAAQLPADTPLFQVVPVLGNGSDVTAPDTVPFCVWVAARHLHNYVDALWTTVQAGGDIDTTAAIVGGIVVMATGRAGIPVEWLEAREELAYRGM